MEFIQNKEYMTHWGWVRSGAVVVVGANSVLISSKGT